MKKFSVLLLLILTCLFVSCNFFNDEEEQPTVTAARFELSEVTLGVGESKQILFQIEPSDMISKTKVEYYTADESSIIDITNPSNNGCVLTGKKNGNCVLIGKCEGFTSYLQVNVAGSLDIEPYIVTPYVVNVIHPGDKISVNVSLYNGNASDNVLFDFHNADDSVCKIENANNAVVVEGVSKGYSKITVSHPKAKYDASILIYVVPETQGACYITTTQNVVMAGLNDGIKNITFNLIGSVQNDLSLFSYVVKEGKDIVSVAKSNNVCSITPLKNGYAVIEATHPDCELSLEIQVIVVNTVTEKYIESDSNLLFIDDGKSRVVNCSVVGSDKADDLSKFSFELTDESIVKVTQINNSFYVEPLRDGQCKIIVKNEYCNYPNEILTVVQNYNEIAQSHYITTSQNVVKMEIGDEYTLNCLLTGGNEADRNGFIWTVDDSSIISFLTSDGTVNYSRSASSADDYTVLKTQGVITAKKIGLATITVHHPKSSLDCNIKVRVYEKGGLRDKIQLKGEGIVKVIKGESTEYTVVQESGNTISSINWSVDDSSIADVNGKSFTAVISGKQSGITDLVAETTGMINPYKAVLMCGTPEELESFCSIYTDNRYPSLMVGDTGYFEVKCSSTIDIDNYECNGFDSSICDARMSQNVLIIKGKKAGKTEVKVTNSQAQNSIVFYVDVMSNETIDKPYYFSFDKFFGLVKGETDTINIVLNGAAEEELNGISWEIEDSSVATISGNADKCRVTALKVGQTVIKAKHNKSSNEVRIVLYTANTKEELASRHVLSLSETNFLVKKGDSVYVEAYINGDDIENIKWENDDISLVNVDDNNDSAYIRCLEEGQAVITVKYHDAASQKIFISIKGETADVYEKDVSLPSILELITGSTKTIKLVTQNINEKELEEFVWSCDDEKVCQIKGNNGECYITALKKGCCNIKVINKNLGIERTIVVVIADTYQELYENSYISLSKSYYNISVGDTLDLSLKFGSKIPEDSVIAAIKWNASDSSIINVVSNGKTCSVTGLQEGISVINVGGEGIGNELKITVAVGDAENLNGKYIINTEKIIGIVNGNSYILKAELMDSYGQTVQNYSSDFSYELDKKYSENIDVEQSENEFNIIAKKTGTSFINIKHSLVNKPSKVLVYTADTQAALDAMYPLATDKDHYLIKVGDSVILSLNTINDEKISGIKWSCSNSSVCSYTMGETKKQLKITARKEGTTIFTAKHEGSEDVNFVITVSDFGKSSGNINILSESIIGLVTGDEYKTSIKTNLSDEECRNITWTVSDDSICMIDGTAKDCTVKALKEGVCELTAKYSSGVYSTIVVYVKENQQKVDSSSFVNIDKRYNYLGLGNTINLRPFFAKKIPTDLSLEIKDIYENNVCSYKYENGILSVKGLNEGIAALKITSKSCENTFVLYFEVAQGIENEVTETDTGYLTINKTVYVMNASDTVTPLEISCIPVGISQDYYSTIKWETENNDVVTIIGSNEKVYIYANKEGNALVHASSVFSANILNIRVIVTKDELITIPYITADRSSVEMTIGETVTVNADIENSDSVDVTKFDFSIENEEIATITKLGNVVKIKGINNGQTLLTIKYKQSGMEDKNIVVSVKGLSDNIVYLTSSDNYSIITEGSYKNIEVNLVGYSEINSNNFTWEVVESKPEKEGKEVIELSGSGTSRLCNALNPGIAKIKVTHKATDDEHSAIYPMYLFVKVTDYLTENPLYISTDNTVVTVTEKNRATIKVNLENGDASYQNQFNYETTQSEVIKLSPAGNQCVVEGLKEGIARVTVSHSRCPGQNIDIVVIVEADNSKDSLYISTDSTLVEMKPSDSYRQIYATLNGGTPEQNTLFHWNILSFESLIKNKDGTSNQVIKIQESQDSCMIKPLCEGSCIIRITNDATRHYLDIKVLVSLYNELKFVENAVNVLAFETRSIDVQCPTGKTILYESSNEKVATVTGTNKKCIVEGTGKGTCVIRAYASDGSTSDELIVNVKENTNVVSSYITSNINIINLNVQDDAKGYRLTAKLNGSNVTQSDQDNITWTISSKNTSIIKFLGSTSYTAKGTEVNVIPVDSGECSIVIHHEKSQNDKTIYVSVEKNNVTLSVSEDYLTMKLNEISLLTATLKNSSEAEVDKITWESENKEIVEIHNGPVVKGGKVNIVAKKTGDCRIICKYNNITKYVTVFVKEEPFVSFPEGSRILGINQHIRIPINVFPKERYNEVEISTTSSVYATVKKILDDTEKICYVDITATTLVGSCNINAKLNNISASMELTVTEDVNLRMAKLVVYDKDNKAKETLNPGSVRLLKTDKKARVYFSTSPKGLKFDNKEGTYLMENINIGSNKDEDFNMMPKGNPKLQVFKLTFGTDSSEISYPDYFEIEPLNCFYGTLKLENFDQNVSVNVPLCITYDDFKPQFKLSGGKKSSFDAKNHVLNIADNDSVQIVVSNMSSYPGMQNSILYRYEYESVSDGVSISTDEVLLNPSRITGSGVAGGTSVRYSTSYDGKLTVTIYYPKYCDVYGEYTETFIVNHETWR